MLIRVFCMEPSLPWPGFSLRARPLFREAVDGTPVVSLAGGYREGPR